MLMMLHARRTLADSLPLARPTEGKLTDNVATLLNESFDRRKHAARTHCGVV
jgi:hypothetical protein